MKPFGHVNHAYGHVGYGHGLPHHGLGLGSQKSEVVVGKGLYKGPVSVLPIGSKEPIPLHYEHPHALGLKKGPTSVLPIGNKEIGHNGVAVGGPHAKGLYKGPVSVLPVKKEVVHEEHAYAHTHGHPHVEHEHKVPVPNKVVVKVEKYENAIVDKVVPIPHLEDIDFI